MARLETANTIMNRVALEIGLSSVDDPFANPDQNFQQLGGLFNSAGLEMVALDDWQALRKTFSFTDAEIDSTTGFYLLPDDFDHMINQTGWDTANNLPMGGPLSPQEWAYLTGRNLVTSTIYPGFRLNQNKLEIFPSPPPDDLEVSFEYITRTWAVEFSGDFLRKDQITNGNDVILFEPILMIKFLKVKWLEAKGLDASAARLEFDTMLGSRKGKDRGAQRLNAGSSCYGAYYLNGFTSVPDSGFGG